MRNANAQRPNSMVRVSALQQPPGPHVSHAEIGGRWCPNSKFGASCLANHGCEIERKTKFPACFGSELLLKGRREGEENF
jgi:hypothetical protein